MSCNSGAKKLFVQAGALAVGKSCEWVSCRFIALAPWHVTRGLCSKAVCVVKKTNGV